MAAPADDPALALVAAHRKACAKFVAASDAETLDHERCEELGKAADKALAELLETPPTTRAGARAAIARLVEFDDGPARRLTASTCGRCSARRLIRTAGPCGLWAAFGRPFLLPTVIAVTALRKASRLSF